MPGQAICSLPIVVSGTRAWGSGSGMGVRARVCGMGRGVVVEGVWCLGWTARGGRGSSGPACGCVDVWVWCEMYGCGGFVSLRFCGFVLWIRSRDGMTRTNEWTGSMLS
ncbi:hypothetical protein F4802DRAFT_41513 [Xylaria palmicola]|nr:hypothetical protein F4802DRAFT_41513 [Xylaria palmicola]